MPYYSEPQLRTSARSPYLRESADQVLKSFAARTQVSISLSHSHLDRELALGLRHELAAIRVSLYIDWEDTQLPDVPNAETGRRIRERIDGCSRFMLLATENGTRSRWVPWELGIADGSKSSNDILIVPVVDSTGRFHGNEYMQLYNSLQPTPQGTPGVYSPNNKFVLGIREWLLRA